MHGNIFCLGDEFDGELPTVGDPKDRYRDMNLVTQYNKTSEGKLEELPQKCVDTGISERENLS